ncbi:MAG: AAA family ATPase [Gammaproteobacteria bacterium AqS3]|nr:AAA family ATPase [Gammaproteobacteria bacterium AqS3]
MYISRVQLKNWRNFVEVDVPLHQRQFLVGPNASGKSNFLDVFRFLHDIAKPKGGGLQSAVDKRGGLSKIRSFHARNKSAEVFIRIDLSDFDREWSKKGGDKPPEWGYEIGIRTERPRSGAVVVSHEAVYRNGRKILRRPDRQDEKDPERLKQTYMEQVGCNEKFREISKFFSEISYMNLLPQLLRHSAEIQGKVVDDDPFGQNLAQRMQKTHKKTLETRLRKISGVVRIVSPGLDDIRPEPDGCGGYHITASCDNGGSKKNIRIGQGQMSDGTLRLIGLSWALLENSSVLLLEEPEESLHSEVVSVLTWLLNKALIWQKKRKRKQIFSSTHSPKFLSDGGVDAVEILLLTPPEDSGGGTKVCPLVDLRDIEVLLKIGEHVGSIATQATAPKNSLHIAAEFKD